MVPLPCAAGYVDIAIWQNIGVTCFFCVESGWAWVACVILYLSTVCLNIPKQHHRTEWLPMIFGRQDHCLFSYWLWVKSLISIENHLHGFHRNSSTVAGSAECTCSAVEFLIRRNTWPYFRKTIAAWQSRG